MSRPTQSTTKNTLSQTKNIYMVQQLHKTTLVTPLCTMTYFELFRPRVSKFKIKMIRMFSPYIIFIRTSYLQPLVGQCTPVSTGKTSSPLKVSPACITDTTPAPPHRNSSLSRKRTPDTTCPHGLQRP